MVAQFFGGSSGGGKRPTAAAPAAVSRADIAEQARKEREKVGEDLLCAICGYGGEVGRGVHCGLRGPASAGGGGVQNGVTAVCILVFSCVGGVGGVGVCMFACVRVCTFTCVSVCMFVFRMRGCMGGCMWVWSVGCGRLFVYVRVSTSVPACMFACVSAQRAAERDSLTRYLLVQRSARQW